MFYNTGVLLDGVDRLSTLFNGEKIFHGIDSKINGMKNGKLFV